MYANGDNLQINDRLVVKQQLRYMKRGWEREKEERASEWTCVMC